MMRPYIQPHPNLGLYIGSELSVCPSCTSQEIEHVGVYATYRNLYDSFRCKNCGAISKSRKGKLQKEERNNLIVSTAR